jgi:hypothetical protein
MSRKIAMPARSSARAGSSAASHDFSNTALGQCLRVKMDRVVVVECERHHPAFRSLRTSVYCAGALCNNGRHCKTGVSRPFRRRTINELRPNLCCTDIPFASAGRTTRAPARSPLSSASFSLGWRYRVVDSPSSPRQTARRRRKNSRSARAVVKRRASRQARSAAACRPRRKWSSPITACQPG